MTSFLNLIKNAYGGLDRTMWLLALIQFINRSGTMVVVFLSVYLKDDLGFSLGQVGTVMALFGAGSITGTFFGGRLIDKIGFYRIMFFSLFFGGLAFILVGWVRSFAVLAVAMFFLSAISECFRPANLAAMSIYSKPETYTRSVALSRLAMNLGFSIGPAIGGFLASIDYNLIFWVDGVTCLIAAGILKMYIEEKRAPKKEKAEAHVSSKSPYKDKIYLLFLPICVFYTVSFFQFFSTMPLYYKDVEHFTEIEIGWLMALNGLIVAVFEMVLIYKFEKKTSLYNFIVWGSVLLILSYISLVFWGGWWWLVFLTIVISFSEMLALPFMNTFMNNRAPVESKGQYASLYVMAWAVAQIITPLIATNMIALSGYNGLWLLLAGFAAVTIFGIKGLERMVIREKNDAS